MKYVVDEIIDNIAIIQNIEDKSKKEVDLNKLPEGINEGNIIIEQIQYIKDDTEEENRRKSLRERLDKLKKTSST